MDELVHKYSSAYPPLAPKRNASSALGVVLTGSTGSLGLRILHSLVAEPRVKHIICLDRSQDAKQRIAKTMPAMDLSGVTFYQAFFGKPNFGLTGGPLQNVIDKADVIIHCAWKVNFNQPLSYFEDVHIRGIKCLVDFAATSPRRPQVHFISSVGSVVGWSAKHGGAHAPEEVVHDTSYAFGTGYGASKLVAERILGNYVDHFRGAVGATVHRVGQIAGPAGAGPGAGPAWNSTEWFPSMLVTSKSLGCLPAGLRGLDWLPVDVVAAGTVDIALHDADAPPHPRARVYNIVNPRSTPWEAMLPLMQERLGGIPVVSVEEWFRRLIAVDRSAPDAVKRFPALRLTQYWGGVAENSGSKGWETVFSTVATINASRCLRTVPRVGTTWMGEWLTQMGYPPTKGQKSML